MTKNVLFQLGITLCLAFSTHSYSLDISKLQVQPLSKSKAAYKVDVIRRALEITTPSYGDFQLDVVEIMMSGNRIFQSSLEGDLINTVIQPSNELLDKHHLVIRIPVRLGLLNYRLLMVDKADVDKFSKITTVEDLNHFKAGLGTYWETTKIFKKHNLNIVETSHIPSIFPMLQKHRFDYLPRGIYEIYDELDSRQNILNSIVVEPTLALHIPMYTYVYVSPKLPRLANRLQSGLRQLIFNGELKEILFKHYAKDINRANLASRKVITLENRAYQRHDSEYDKYLLSRQEM